MLVSETIKVKNLVKRYKKSKVNAVDDISFDVNEGEFFSFLGPNGAGKTTAISILTTTLSKTSGEVMVAGYDLDKQQSEIRKRIGIIFQNPSLDLNLTAEENIRFHAVLYGLYPFAPTYSLMSSEYKKKVKDLSDIIGIGSEMKNPVKSFSGGMKRKLEIIRSLMHDPKVLFLDEPTTGLDPLSRNNLWEYLKSVRSQNGTTVFLTTHYLEEAEESDRVVIINKGKIVADGTPRQIKNKLIKEYLILESNDSSKLEEELKSKDLKFESMGNRFKVFIDDPKDLQVIINSIKSKLTYIDIHLPTLEDAYLEVIKVKEDI